MKDMKPTMKNAIRAFCHQCMGHYSDSERDCQNAKCPLYPFLKYHKLEPDFDWTRYNPSRVGQVLFADCEERIASENALQGLKLARERRSEKAVDTE
jgi:hypothetical protein